MRILSGIQTSGTLHIGNYFGMIRQMLDNQDKGELFCFLANLHALTSLHDGPKHQALINDAFIDLLALGIDPEKSTLWVQSDTPEVCELTWYLSNVTPMGLLERCHSYKDKTSKNIAANLGLFSYPVLMAADILLFQSNIVPVGKDQKQHVEVARDIAIKFNQTFGEVFTIPEPRILDNVALIPGTDGQKMSKSYGNTLDIFAPEKELKKKVMSIVTDPTPLEEPKDPDKSVIHQLYRLVATPSEVEAMAGKFRAGGYGYGDAKKTLFAAIFEFFLEARNRRAKICADPDYVAKMRKLGASKARAAAMATLQRVKELVGVL